MELISIDSEGVVSDDETARLKEESRLVGIAAGDDASAEVVTRLGIQVGQTWMPPPKAW